MQDKLWTYSISTGTMSILGQVRGLSARQAADNAMALPLICAELRLRWDWSVSDPLCRQFGPDKSGELVGVWDLTLLNAEGSGIQIQLVETVDQDWEFDEEE